MDAQRQDELFDVVDEQDRVIGQATRGEVHAQNLRHRAVHVIIYNDKGELFLQKRSTAKDKFPGCWDSSCSGHVDAGEEYDRAARRELVEELGYHATLPLRPLFKLPCCEATGFEFIQIYLLGPTNGPFQLNPHEISEGEFVAPRHIDTYLSQYPQFLAGAFRYLWANHREQIVQGLLPAVPGFRPLPPPAPAAKANPKGWLAGLGVLGVFLAKFGFFFAKFGKMLVSMLFTLWAYTVAYGWKFAVSVVLFLFLLTFGRILMLLWYGLPASLPLFIPFFGTVNSNSVESEPDNAWMEAVIASGGPLLSGVASWIFLILGIALGENWMIAGASIGFVMNLFNLIPMPPLNGGRICAAVSPWFWIVGLMLSIVAIFYFRSIMAIIILGIILFTGMPRLLAAFNRKNDPVEQAYYDTPLWKRILMAVFYLGLVCALLIGLFLCKTYLVLPTLPHGNSPNVDDTGADS